MLFKYPLFFTSLLALGIPIYLHFFGKRTYIKHVISTIEFLKFAEAGQVRKKTLLYYLLLIARLVALFFLVLTFTQPFLPQKMSSDASLSNEMHYSFDNSPSVYSLPGLDKILLSVANLQDADTTSISQRLSNNYIQNEPSLADLVEESSFSASNGNICIFSDFQKHFVEDKKVIFSDKKITFVHLGELNKSNGNISIDSAWLDQNFVKKGSSNKMSVLLKNNGTIENKNAIIELRWKGKAISTKTVEIPASSMLKVDFPVSIEEDTMMRLEFHINDGVYDFDNHLLLSIPVLKQLNVALKGNFKQNNNPIKFAYDQDEIFNLKNTDFYQQDLIIYRSNPKTLASDIAELKQEVERGKTAVIFPEKSGIDVLMPLLKSQFNFSLIKVNSNVSEQLALPDTYSPTFKGVFENKQKDIQMPFVIPLLKIKDERTRQEIILKNKTQQPLIERLAYKSGSIVLFSFDPIENPEFERNSLFLPLFYRIAEMSKSKNEELYKRINQRTISYQYKVPVTSKTAFSIENRNIKIVPGQRVVDNIITMEIPSLNLPLGYWKIKQDTSVVGEFSLNFDKKESIQNYYSVAELKDKFANHKNIKVVSYKEFSESKTIGKEIHWSSQIWRYAVAVSFLFLFGEILIAQFNKTYTKSSLITSNESSF